MPLLKKKKAQDQKPDDEKKNTKGDKTQSPEKKKEQVTPEKEESETGSDEESSEEDESETTEQITANTPKKDDQKTTEPDKNVKEEEETEESESEYESDEESEYESETEKTETRAEEATTAQDATMEMSAAPTDLGDTVNTTAEIPDEATDAEEMFEAIDNYKGEEDGDLDITVGDRLTILYKQNDGWWEAENERGQRGLVPSTYLKQIERQHSPKSGKILWGGLKKTITKTTTTDILHMMGSVPTGFRKEYLNPISSEMTTSLFLLPKLSPSNLSFRDLYYNPSQSKVRSRQSQWCRMILMNEFKNIPLPGHGTRILKRYVRICLFDGSEVCSNIIRIQAMCLDREERIWTFNHKESEHIQSGKLGQIFVRTNQKNPHIGVLFELGIIFLRESSDSETEMICGWSHIPLYEDSGNPTPNKIVEIPVHGGTPEDKGVPLDTDVGTNQQTNVFRSLMLRNRAPVASLRIIQPSKEQRELLDLLPDTLIGSAAHINAFSFFRRILADQLLRDREDMMSTEPICDPYLATFPLAANDPFLIDLLRSAWIETQKKMNRQQKKDQNFIKSKYIKCYMDKVYPRLCLTPEHLDKEKKDDKTNPVRSPRFLDPLAMLLSPEVEFRPFKTDEIAFNIIHPKCTKVW